VAEAARPRRGPFGRERRIGRRLILLVLSFSAGATLCFTGIQLAFQYRDLHRALDRQLEGVGLYVRSLEGSVWDFDERQVQRAIGALVLVPNVAFVRVTDASTGKTWAAGEPPAGAAPTRVYPLLHNDRGVEREIGRVEIVATLEGIRRQMIGSALSLVLGNALLTIVIALVMVLLIRRLVTARLERMAARVRGLAPSVLPGGSAADARPVPADLDELDAVDWALTRATADLGAAVGALRESEARYRRIVETSHEGIWVVDAAARIVFTNGQMAGFLGGTVDGLRGASLIDFVHEEGRAAARALLDPARKEGGAPELLRFRRRDGTDRYGLVGTTPLQDETGAPAGALGMVADVTEQRLLEEQLRRSQKLEAVGQLAAGVAHDFNNLLTAMLGDAQLMAEQLPPASELHDAALEIEGAVQRAALLTRQLLAFGRKETATPRVLDLNELVTSTERMLRRLIGEDVELVTVLSPALWRVRADPGQVEQVIVNLAVNARDAMPGGGRLTIETGNIERPARGPAGGAGDHARPFVVVSVADTGTGMSDEVQAHLFEPFFTTKAPGKGTGLGLSTVYGIVKQAGGDVVVASEPGSGTTVRVYLPRTDDAADATADPRDGGGMARGTETVLVVDDEPLVGSIVARTLGAAGYTVLSAESCDEALAIAASAGQGIDLLVTDLVLRGPGGADVAARIRDAVPGLPVLFVSGYTDRAVDLSIYGGTAAFLAKPFTGQELTARVRGLLDRPERLARGA
jgi:PAS domain S-box-containing protein